MGFLGDPRSKKIFCSKHFLGGFSYDLSGVWGGRKIFELFRPGGLCKIQEEPPKTTKFKTSQNQSKIIDVVGYHAISAKVIGSPLLH